MNKSVFKFPRVALPIQDRSPARMVHGVSIKNEFLVVNTEA